jgi:hypothetical protein
VVERDLAKVDVAGSTPVSRSRFLPASAEVRFMCRTNHFSRNPMPHEGVVDNSRRER